MIEKALVTEKAKQNMLDLHSEKYIKAWLDKIHHAEKLAELKKDWSEFDETTKERVEYYLVQRQKDAAKKKGPSLPHHDLQAAVQIKMTIESIEGELSKAQLEFDFFKKIVNLINTL